MTSPSSQSSKIMKFTPSGKTPTPIVVGEAEKKLTDLLNTNNVVDLDKLTIKIAPQDFLELSAMLEYLVKSNNNTWTWRGPAISSIPTSTDIISDLNNLKVTTLNDVTEIRNISKVELSKLVLLGKLVYLNGKWGWNYKTVPTQLIDDLNSIPKISQNVKTIVSSQTIQDMMDSRYLLLVDGKWIWNSTMDPVNFSKSNGKTFEKCIIVAIGIILFLILVVIGFKIVKFY